MTTSYSLWILFLNLSFPLFLFSSGTNGFPHRPARLDLSASFLLTGNDVIFTVRRQMFGIAGTPRKCLRLRASAQFDGSADTWHRRRKVRAADRWRRVCVSLWTRTLSGEKKRGRQTSVRLPGSLEVKPPVISFYSKAALLFLTQTFSFCF